MLSLLVVLALGATPDVKPAPSEVAALAPRLGRSRTYEKAWVEGWIGRCSRGSYTEPTCRCMMGASKFHWNFKQIKRITRNVRELGYVPEHWFSIEKMCVERHEPVEQAE